MKRLIIISTAFTFIFFGGVLRGDAQVMSDKLPQGEPVQTAKGTYFKIDVDQVKPLLEDNSVFTVNVHIPYAGELPGTDALIPFNKVAQQIDAFPADKDVPVVVYCLGSGMSTKASKALADMGYTRVFSVTGGMNAWQRAGNELVQR